MAAFGAMPRTAATVCCGDGDCCALTASGVAAVAAQSRCGLPMFFGVLCSAWAPSSRCCRARPSRAASGPPKNMSRTSASLRPIAFIGFLYAANPYFAPALRHADRRRHARPSAPLTISWLTFVPRSRLRRAHWPPGKSHRKSRSFQDHPDQALVVCRRGSSPQPHRPQHTTLRPARSYLLRPRP